MNRQKRNGERGTALILVMIMTVIVTGMIAAMFILTMNAGENAQGHIDRTAALATAEAALNMAIEDAVSFQVDWTNGIGWVEQNRSSSNQDRVWATKTVNGIPCTIVVRSAFQSHTLGTARNIHYMSWPLRTDQDVDGDGTIDEAELFDVYEIIVISGQRQADGTWQGTGKDDYVAGMRAIIEIDQVELPDIIPSPLYIDSDVDPTFVGNATVSGEDHDPEDTRETGAFRMPFEGTIELTYEPLGYAGLKSDFRMIDPETGEEIIIYEDNTGSDTTPVDGRVFTQEEALNFFILTKGSAWGIGDYIHQADQNHINGYDPDSGRTYCKKFVLDGDGKTILNDGRHVDVEFRDGDQNIYEAGTNNVVDPVLVNLDQNLSDYAYDDPTQPGRKIVSLRMGFEDLPAEENPDWDYEDVVVKVDIVQTYCDTCSGAGFLTCGSCEGSGMQNANHACNTCGGDGVVDCPDCSPQQVVDTPWYEMDELQSLTGNPGKNALASSNTVLNTVYPDTEVTEENQSGLVWDTVVRNGGGADNKTTDFRTGKDGFDAEAVANGEMSIEDRPLDFGVDAVSSSTMDLDAMAMQLIGAAEDADGNMVLPGTNGTSIAGNLKDGVTSYSAVKNGANQNDIGNINNMKVTYIEGDAGTMAGQVEGGGVLVINGDAHISGQFVYAGLVIVLGDLVVSGGGNNGMHSLGAVLVKGEVDLRGNSAIWWSERIIDDVLKLTEYPPSIRYGSKTWTTLTKGDVEWMGY